MAISLKEIIKDASFGSLPKDIQDNLMTLLERMNKIRTAYGKSMTVSSGLRTIDQHLAIYKAKGITDKSKIPMKSAHLFGAACDAFDKDKDLQKWCLKNESFLEEVGLWMESFDYTPTWCHFQIYPPLSKKRWFRP